MSSPKREERPATARTARDSDLLQIVERRLEQEARGVLDPGALDRARRRAQALAVAGTVWIADEDSRPRLLARVGAEPTRRVRAAAAETLFGHDGPPAAASIRAFPITRWERVEAALVVRAARNDRTVLVLAAELAARLSPTIERAR